MSLQIIYNYIYDYHLLYNALPRIEGNTLTFEKKFKGLSYFDLPTEAIEKIREHMEKKFDLPKTSTP